MLGSFSGTIICLALQVNGADSPKQKVWVHGKVVPDRLEKCAVCGSGIPIKHVRLDLFTRSLECVLFWVCRESSAGTWQHLRMLGKKFLAFLSPGAPMVSVGQPASTGCDPDLCPSIVPVRQA